MKFVRSTTDFRWNGNYYANHSDWQFHFATIALSFIEISSDAHVLDIGCGDGRFTKYVASLVPEGKVLGLDSSPLMLSVAETNSASNLAFVLGDIINLPFKNQFDRILSFNCLHWILEIKTALEQVREALIPGGKALILVAPVQVRHPIHKIIDEVAKKSRWHPHFSNALSTFSFHTISQWASMIEEARMIPESLQLIDASYDYANKKAFADWIAGWIPFGTIPEGDRLEYVYDIVEAYTSIIPCNPNGIIRYGMDELVIVASTRRLSKN